MKISRREIIGIALVALVLGGLWLSRQQRSVPLPPNATGVQTQLGTLARQTSFATPWRDAELRAFYRSELPTRGWRYCGTQATQGCSKMFPNLDPATAVVDVYRRADDANGRGPTVEIWPTQDPNATRVTIFESTSV